MSGLLLPALWAVMLAGQLVVWLRSLRPDRLDRLAPRKLIALRWSAEAVEGPGVASVLGVALLVGALAASIQRDALGWSYLGIGVLLLVEALVTRRLATRLVAALADRGRLPLPPEATSHETRRRRSGLAALIGFSVVTMFPPSRTFRRLSSSGMPSSGPSLSSRCSAPVSSMPSTPSASTRPDVWRSAVSIDPRTRHEV